jgi:hypothetical protein
MMIYGSLICATAADSHTVSICPIESVTDWIFGFRDQNCVVSGANESPCFAGVTEVRRHFYFFLAFKRKNIFLGIENSILTFLCFFSFSRKRKESELY